MGVRLTVFLPCKEIIHESKNHAAGGGSRILALLAATATILLFISPMPAQTAKADDQHLYCVAKNSTKLVDSGKTAADINLFLVTGVSGGFKQTLVKDSAGHWNRVDPSTCQFEQYGMSDWQITTDGLDYLNGDYISINAYAALGYATITPGKPGGLGIDNDGKAWFISTPTGNSMVNADRTRTLSDAYRFTKIMPYYGYDSDPTGGALLLGSPHDTSKTGYVAQMPTSGAPTGLSTVGVAALVLCLLGMSVMTRRRD